MHTTIDTRICTQPACHTTFRAQGQRPPCPKCGETLTLVVDSQTTNDPGQNWTRAHDPYPVRTN